MVNFIKGLFMFILFLVGVTIYALFSLTIYSMLQSLFVDESDYIVFIPNNVLMIIGVLVPLFFIFMIKSILLIQKPALKYSLHFIFYCMVVVFYLYAFKDYTVVYENKIIDHQIFNYHQYSYEDIQYVTVGVYESGRYKEGSFYYILILNDGKQIDLNQDTSTVYEPYIGIQIIDQVIKNKNINKMINKDSIHALPDDFDYKTKKIIKDLMEITD